MPSSKDILFKFEDQNQIYLEFTFEWINAKINLEFKTFQISYLESS